MLILYSLLGWLLDAALSLFTFIGRMAGTAAGDAAEWIEDMLEDDLMACAHRASAGQGRARAARASRGRGQASGHDACSNERQRRHARACPRTGGQALAEAVMATAIPMATIARVLRAARSLLDGRPKCTGALARDVHGHPIDSTDPRAKCWCLLGAINLSAGSLDETAAAVAHFNAVTGIQEPVAWFESPITSMRDVIAALDLAIREAERV